MAEIRVGVLLENSDWVWSPIFDEMKEEQLEEFKKIASEIKNLDSFHMTDEDGSITYFNPDKILSIKIEKKKAF